MRILYRRIGVIAGFSLLLAILMLNATITRRQLGIQIGAESWVSHSHQVLLQLNQLELLLADAETGQRGYLYTGESKYLAPYQDALSKIDPQIDAITTLTADNPRQQALIPQLRLRVHAKVDEMAQVIAFQQSANPQAARDLVLTARGLLLMEHIRLVISQMEDEESQLQASRLSAYGSSVRQTILSIYLSNGLAVLGLVLLAYYLLRELEMREMHNQRERARDEWSRVTLASIGDAVIATDKQGVVIFLNPIAETLIGNDQAHTLGKNILEVFPIINERTLEPADNPVKKVLETGQVVALANHTALVRKDGAHTPIEDSAAPIRGANGELLGVVLVFRDVTTHRKTHEALRRSERLAAASRLSATMAHEINNPLQAVASLVFLSRMMPDVPPLVIEKLTLAELELQRVAHIVQQTLGFFKDSQAAESVEMSALVDSVLALYSNKLKSKEIRISRRFGGSLPVQAAAGELRQVIANLIANAADAVQYQGTIDVTLESLTQAGQQMLHILVEDDGPGIPPEHKSHLFEPFFTTKQDVGTGLGLWLTKEVVERHGGKIDLVPRTDGNVGAAFSILLPGSPNSPQPPAGNPQHNTSQPSGLIQRDDNDNLTQKEQ